MLYSPAAYPWLCLSVLSACHYTPHVLTSFRAHFPLQIHLPLLVGCKWNLSLRTAAIWAKKKLTGEAILQRLLKHVYWKMFSVHRGYSVPTCPHIHHLQHCAVLSRWRRPVCQRWTHYRGSQIHGGTHRRGCTGEFSLLLSVTKNSNWYVLVLLSILHTGFVSSFF